MKLKATCIVALTAIALFASTPRLSAEPVSPRIQFSPEGHATRNGRPAFPLGIYVALRPSEPDTLEPALDDLADSPFDFFINYGGNVGTDEQIAHYYALLANRGLSEFYPLEKFYKDIQNESWQLDFPESEQEIIQSHVSRAKGHKAIAGWYILDERPLNPELVRQHHEWVKEIDPDRPTLSLVYERTPETINPYAPTGDIFAVDNYPIPTGGRVESIGTIVNYMIDAVREDQPAWFVPQAFGNYVYIDRVRDRSGPPLRPSDPALRHHSRAPTPAEMRAMCFTALVHGARGLAFYYYTDIKLAYDAEVRWNAVKEIAADIKSIEPILLAETLDPADYRGENFRQAFSADNFAIQWLVKKLDGKLYFIAVNTTREYQATVFDNIPMAHVKSTRVLVGDGYAQASSEWGPTEMLIGLDALGVIVVELEPHQ